MVSHELLGLIADYMRMVTMTSSDLEAMKAVLDNQAERGIKSGDWPELKYEIIPSEKGSISLRIESLEVGFCFTAKGRLLGAYNWKQ